MTRLKIKICGITRIQDAVAALEAGADFIGLNLYAGPRKMTVQQAGHILTAIPDPRVSAVALVDLSTPEGYAVASELAQAFGVRTFQLYGDLAQTRPVQVPQVRYWPVFHIARRDDLRTLPAVLESKSFSAAALLLDAFSTRGHGGTGTRIDLAWLAETATTGELRGLPPFILAGGLRPDNIAEVLKTLRPWAVDVSSGVEYAGRPGIKDHAMMSAFIGAVRAADKCGNANVDRDRTS
ncbi:MAG: phosphoribosylanthranilate isomerase [Phycisphaerae bacterium]